MALSKETKKSVSADEEFWLQCVREWYPERHKRAYFVPFVFMNRVPYAERRISGELVLVHQAPEGLGNANPLDGQACKSKASSTRPDDQSTSPSVNNAGARPKDQVGSRAPKSSGARAEDNSSPHVQARGFSQRGRSASRTSKPAGHACSQTSTKSRSRSRRKSSSADLITVYESDVKDDKAQQRVVCCLQKLADVQPEPMVVLSQMKIEDYLNKQPYEATCKRLPRPRDLGSKLKRGDFDILIIHETYGLIVFEIKAVLENREAHKLTEDGAIEAIRKRVRRAVEQIVKEETVLSYLVQDLAAGLSIIKTLVLPTVTKAQLQHALESDQQLQKEFCKCFGDPSSTASVSSTDKEQLTACIDLCLCSDDMSSHDAPCQVTADVLVRLKEWWHRRVASRGPDKVMTADVFDRLLARFCGPATAITVPCVTQPRMELRTHAQAVSETGERVSRIALTPDQVNLLHSRSRRMLVSGPPGTGKTVTLLLMGKQWLTEGNNVHVVSLWPGSYAASFMIYCQLMQTTGKRNSRLRCALRMLKAKLPWLCDQLQFHNFDITDDKGFRSAIGNLARRVQNKQLYILADECGPDKGTSERSQRFYEELYKTVGAELRLWAASMYHVEVASCMDQKELTVPLRCPPKVVNLVQEAPQIQAGDVVGYTHGHSEVTVPCQGPEPVRLYHNETDSEGHAGHWPYDCPLCADRIVQKLTEFGVGATDTASTTSPSGPSSDDSALSAPPALQFRDVMILAGELHAFEALKKALKSAGIPFNVVLAGNRNGIEDMARAAKDQVILATIDVARGLERKVVVVVEREWEMDDSAGMRLSAMSRCMSQLVWVSRIP